MFLKPLTYPETRTAENRFTARFAATSSTRYRRKTRATVAFCLCVASACPSAAFASPAVTAPVATAPVATAPNAVAEAPITLVTKTPAVAPTAAPAVSPANDNATNEEAVVPTISDAKKADTVALAALSSAAPSSFNVLILPMDNLSAAVKAEVKASAVSPGDAAVSGSDVARIVGPAEAAAAPLRRAMLKRGWSDVLSANFESSVLRRAVAENRLPQRVLDQLRDAMTSVVVNVATAGSAPSDASAKDATSSGAVATSETATAIVPTIGLSAQMKPFADATQSAILAASRLGQALNYRAVLVLTLAPDSKGKMSYVMLLADALRETGELSAFDVPSANATSSTGSAGALTVTRQVSYQNSAEIGSALLQQKLTDWARVPGGDRVQITTDSLAAARRALAENRLTDAREALTRVLSFDAKQRDALLLMGDVQVKSGDLDAAVMTYRRALNGDGEKGAVWTQIAVAYAASRNWPETLNAAREALATNGDSLALRLAMATAQLGRARLFDDAGRSESAADALSDADIHLAKARRMAPDDPAVLRLMADQMAQSSNARGALQMLDRAAPQLVADRDFQVSYATLLVGRSGRELDAFKAWMRATKLSDNAAASATSSTGSAANGRVTAQLPVVDRARFRRLVEGYDQMVSKMVARAFTQTDGIIQGNISRERAVLEIKPLTSDIALANQILKSLTPPDDRLREAFLARLEIGDTFSQALNAYEMYAENADDALYDKAVELHKNAMTRLNALRS